ncbi:hypothetical protein MRB53_035161 [Persea americana]|uniref:Uncharacterized protein n=1 Tax=Persea americana TaxID=3435 RepID=A0ACC2K3R6_PERAE|nr:hypothetical protein MRB53_035161 [Persea americana]
MMIKEFLPQMHGISLGKEEVNKEMKQKMQHWRVMENPDLTLGLSRFIAPAESSNSSSSESEANSHRKRKFSWDHLKSDSMIQNSIELQLKDPLPLDWEQCLDLESGRMYYLNRKTLKKSYNWPKEQRIDLELNISTLSNSDEVRFEISKKPKESCSSDNMVAVACLKCHLLVMLSRSSPTCPNCKYLHSLPTHQSPPAKVAYAKSLETLRLLN